jgi:hypothetical protein
MSTATAGPSDITVPAQPFREWLQKQKRTGWANCLTANQVRYIERVLDPGRALKRLSPYYIDEILFALDQTSVLHELYPD